jgi:23S rRNA (uracil1939-C5)-methyltransferase
MKRGEELELTVESAAFEGKSVSRVEGLVLFVRGAVPGDRVRVRVTSAKKSFAEADVVAMLAPSPLRVAPRCRYFGTCGGCTWQQVDYAAQLQFKRQHVVDALERIGGFRGVTVHPTLGSDRIYGYRNKMEFSFGDRWLPAETWSQVREQSAESSGDRFALGLHLRDRFNKILDLEECWLPSDEAARIVNVTRTFCIERGLTAYSTWTHTGYLRNLVVRRSERSGEVMVNIVTSDDRPDVVRALWERLSGELPGITTLVNNITQRKSQVALGEREIVVFGPGTITERIGKRTYRISANSFFQTNSAQAEKLYDTARTLAGFSKDDLVFDLYSGTGTIALHIADDVRSVVGIESAAPAVEDARQNAATNSVDNCTFLLGDLKDTLTREREELARFGPPDVVIVDPPRSGMHGAVIDQLRSLAPRRIVYVSCNPATQARDLKLLCDHNLFRLEDVQPVDMFPHTFHIESVASISRVGS